MRILAIRGRNLASLAREFEVDLTTGELGDAGIFAICGPVGAGKSTLLDALCLALFDRTPRLSGRGGVAVAEVDRPEGHWLHSHDPRTLLRRGAGDGHAQVDFTGRDGRRYRATWSVRRARRRADGRIQNQEMSLEDLDADTTIARANRSEVLAAIRARLGLDFAQFCRSVLLAQGEFAAFLRASADERASLLESLTGADIYRRLSRAAHERCKLEKQRVETLVAQSSSLGLLDDSERGRLEGEARSLAEQAATDQVALDLAQRVVSWYVTAANCREEEDRATADLQAAAERNRKAEPRRERVRVLSAALPLVPRAELVATRQRAVVDAVGTRESIEVEVQQLRRQHSELRAAQRAELARVMPIGDDRLPPIVEDFDRWQAALARWSRSDRELRELGDVDAAVVEARREHERVAASVRKARAALETEEFRDIAAERRAIVDERTRMRAISERWHGLERLRAEAARCDQVIRDKTAELQQLAIGVDRLVEAQRAAEEALAACRSELEHLRAVGDLSAYRQHLVAGAPCPLCGGSEHPSPAEGDDEALRRAEAAFASAERAREQARDAVRERDTRRRQGERELEVARVAGEPAGRQVAEAAAVWREVAGDLAARSLDEVESDLAERERAFADRADRHEALLTGLQQQQSAERQTQQALRDAQVRADRAVVLAGQRDEAAAELAPAMAGIGDWQACLRAFGGRVVERVEALAAGSLKCRDLQDRVGEAERRLAAQRDLVEREERELQDASKALASAAVAAEVTAADVRDAAELGAAAIAAEQQRLREFAEAEGEARAVLRKCAEIRKRHEDTNRPVIDESDATQALEDTRAASARTKERLEDVRAQLKADDFLRRQRAEIEPRLAAAEAAYEIWLTLDDLIGHSRGDAFAVFAQGLTLDLLLVEANRRLAELARRYRLEKNRGRDMDFVVVDLDLGGVRRGLQSLSGGETFLVSLALALALATLAAPRSRVETLFLDEGFGTLDAGNLEGALGALDSLQATGCQIGVISHVEGIAERIGTVVDVLPEGGGQSRIRVRTG